MSHIQDREETKDWDRFWGSGRVDDYLRYKNCPEESGKAGDKRPYDETGKNRKPESEREAGYT